MSDFRLAKLPDRAPIKQTINLLPELYDGLETYGRAYAAAYETAEPVSELILAMLAAFLDSDRAFRTCCTRQRCRYGEIEKSIVAHDKYSHSGHC